MRIVHVIGIQEVNHTPEPGSDLISFEGDAEYTLPNGTEVNDKEARRC
ncbi:hypothetical protein [Peribacillus sp. SCS-37]